MNTPRMNELRNRMKADNKNWVARVGNRTHDVDGNYATVVTTFVSSKDSIKNVLHKIELYLMSNLHLEMDADIIVDIRKQG